MNGEDHRDEDSAGAVARARGFVGRARRVPGTMEELASQAHESQAQTEAALDDVRAALARLEQLGWDGRNDTRGGVTALAEEIHRLRRHVDDVGEQAAGLDGAVAAQAAALRRSIQAPARTAAAQALRESLGPAPDLEPGLSVFILCWNHGQLLPEAVASAQAVLDALDPSEQGEILVLDDASTDSTPRVAAELAAGDPRVRVIRSEENLGLGHARSTLLHASRTRHALQLDADDLAHPAGVRDLYEVARRTGAAATFGTVVQSDVDGEAKGAVSNEPPTAAFFRSNYIGTIAVSDLAVYRRLGGWPTDPLLEHIDDWSSLHHVIAEGLLLAFVPTVVAEYREWPTGFHHTVPDPRLGQDRVARVYDPTGIHRGASPMTGVAAVAYHPTVGPLWATPEAIAIDPTLAPAPLAPVVVERGRPRVLLIGPGGVSNLGDDAITVRATERAREAFGADAEIDVITDGPPTRALPGGSRWVMPLTLAIHALDPEALGEISPRLSDAAQAAGVGTARWRPLDLAAYDAAVFLGCGLSARWAEGTIVPRALLAAALRTAGVPFVCSGQGYSMGDDEEAKALLASFVAGAVAVGCRDASSADLARSLPGVDPSVVTVTGDDALGLAPAGSAARWRSASPLGRSNPESTGTIAVTVRRADYVGDPEHDPVEQWALAVDALALERGWDVLGVALNAQAPEPEIVTLAGLKATVALRSRWRIVDSGDDPGRLVAAMAGADAVATQSYHAAVFALSAGVPAVLGAASDYYVDKAEGLADLSRLPRDLAVVDPSRISSSLDSVAAALAATDGLLPLEDARQATDNWWRALPVALGIEVG